MKLAVFYLVLLLLLCILSNRVHCSYPTIIKDNSLPLPPHQFAVATIVYNDTIYSYGGNMLYNTKGTDKLFSYTLDQSTGEMVVKLENEGQGPICTFCSAVLFPNSTEMLVFSAPNYNESSIFFHNQTMWQANQTVLPHFYDLEKKTWRVAPPTKKDGQDQTFYKRMYHTTVLNGNDGVYILGGFYSKFMKDGWYYNRYENSYTAISVPNNGSYVEAIGYIDLDGKLAFLGGCNETANDLYNYYYDATKINIYDNITKTWSYKQVESNPHWEYQMLAGAATQVDYDRKLLYASGGYYANGTLQYLYQSFSMLDLEKNVWIYGAPKENSEIQLPHYSASGALIMNNTYFVKLFGTSEFVYIGLKTTENQVTELNTVDVLDLKTLASFTNQTYAEQLQPINWITSILKDDINPSKNKALKYLGLISVLVVFIAVALLFYFRRRSLPLFWHGFKKKILWSPRKGEPIWIEMTRLFIKVLSFVILISFLVYNINDVLTSWNWDSMESDFFPVCNYIGNNVESKCDLDLINSFYYTPHYATQSDTAIRCYLYAPKYPIQVSPKNATILITTQGYTYKRQESIYIQIYRREENMNRIIFNNETIPGITESDVQSWSINETQSDLQVTTYPNSYTKIEYQETDYKEIRGDKKWNYFGAYADFNNFTRLSIDFSQPVIPNSIGRNETQQFFYHSFTLTPKEFRRTTVTEKRDSTILGMFGSIGGVVSLLIAVQIILFGTRPSSPWGIFHYWTWKSKSAPPELEEQFYISEAQIPFINPVHQRFNDVFKKNSDQVGLMNTSSSSSISLIDKENIEERVARLEARNQVLELVMKNYYLDDQVFLALEHPQRASEEENGHCSSDDKEPDYEKLSFRSDIPMIDPHPKLYPNK
ncbi:hypothetical protein K501DRAFT_275879 [Backusella circina FSU 941]|nr:hypothetical protein K501DRAFT_275879 [Backusella circina FSU 941]